MLLIYCTNRFNLAYAPLNSATINVKSTYKRTSEEDLREKREGMEKRGNYEQKATARVYL